MFPSEFPSGLQDDNDLPFAAFNAEIIVAATPLRSAITDAYRQDEGIAARALLAQMDALRDPPALQTATETLARRLVEAVRTNRGRASGVDALMQEFSLSSDEGIALMCLAEALLRIPDHQTADRLIADKLGKGDWRSHLGESPSLFVNAATWGLLITGKLVGSAGERGFGAALTRLINKGGEPLIRKGVDLAMRMLGKQFVTGRTIDEALRNGRTRESAGYRYSYDMLGEAALTAADADRYYAAYLSAIDAIGRAGGGRGVKRSPGISIKLSALHPRYSRAQRARVLHELLPRLQQLVLMASRYRIGLNIDAEEADRLELSLDLMEALAFDPALAGYEGLGFVVQAYQKRCPHVIDYLVDLAHRSGRKLMVRLVKGAYWDAEIKRAQVDGLPGYPVFTHKAYTDVSYLVCAQRLLAASAVIYPQFATHNALTVAAIVNRAQAMQITDYEFQCLHGMGESLYDQVVGVAGLNVPCRIYAPVGSHETLLAYLVRRLLENGANSSFVNQLVDPDVTIDSLLADPVARASALGGASHAAIALPADLFGVERRNSAGFDLTDEHTLRALATALGAFGRKQWRAMPLPGRAGLHAMDVPLIVRNPACTQDQVGVVLEADAGDTDAALALSVAGAAAWQAVAPASRAAILQQAAALFEQHGAELMALAIREAGKSLPNAIAELREAIDFLRYYGAQTATAALSSASVPFPSAPRNRTETHSHTHTAGPIVCISPWNFPLAIFTGQVSAALAAGNAVLAKPAEQTSLIAFRAVQLLHEAGVPGSALQLLPGPGETIGAQLVGDARVRGVLFTGSTQVAQSINRTLARRTIAEGRDIVLIAETGGQNALIVDSSALCEQVVQDVIASAFDSAGQRCSALRLLCLQNDIADKTLEMLHGALDQLSVGRPDRLATDIGPVIDAEAQLHLLRYIAAAPSDKVHVASLPAATADGTFIAPTLIEIDDLSALTHEVFGPVLHVLRYRHDDLPQLIAAINATGYGLTLGVHSRIDETIDLVVARAHAGNIYVNRNIVGAVVGVQPFGGEGLSGTGPKAGGPLYLKRLQRPATVSPEEIDALVQPSLAGGGGVKQSAADQTVDPAVIALLSWADNHGHQALAALARGYARDNLNGRAVCLPGPTGETNTLRFVPRGAVMCIADRAATLLNQLAAVLATGNQVVLMPDDAKWLPSSLPAAILQRFKFIGNAHQECNDLRFALYDADSARCKGLLAGLAARDGAIVGTLACREREAIACWRLVAERAVCVNTTAAGGNASLMAMQG